MWTRVYCDFSELCGFEFMNGQFLVSGFKVEIEINTAFSKFIGVL